MQAPGDDPIQAGPVKVQTELRPNTDSESARPPIQKTTSLPDPEDRTKADIAAVRLFNEVKPAPPRQLLMLYYPPQTPSTLIATTQAPSSAITYGGGEIDAAPITEDFRISHLDVASGGTRAGNRHGLITNHHRWQATCCCYSPYNSQYENGSDYPTSGISEAPVTEGLAPIPVTTTGDGRVPVCSA
ncbi:hypothetical protein FGADI_12893 [Fusarium gaditjirri]|uniref:Uncharacterized protein n=1 Tax=Fusarium gaditjirri TaxID=282569 RepID=A0A8H4WNL0_9HYPO|nr:hypothetical protein FGADI_12893 [Fusarium gaditjirri]